MTTDRPTFKPRNRANSHTPKNRSSRTFWIETLVDFSESGLSVQKFCRLKNLAPSNFYNWRKRLREEESNEYLAPSPFIPLEAIVADKPPGLTRQSVQNQEVSISPDIEREESDSGLILHFNDTLKICINKKFHEPTLQRLVHLFSSGNISTC